MFSFVCKLIHGKHDWEHRVGFLIFGNYWRCTRCKKAVPFHSMPDDAAEILERNREHSRLQWAEMEERMARERRLDDLRYKRFMVIARYRARRFIRKHKWSEDGTRLVEIEPSKKTSR